MRTQFNIRLPQEHVSRLEGMRGNLTQSEIIMRLIDSEWGRGQSFGSGRSKYRPVLTIAPREDMSELVADMNKYLLDDLEDAIYARRLDISATGLRDYGMLVLTGGPGYQFNYLMVFAPRWVVLSDADKKIIPPSVFADLDEARHLMDFLHNLPPAEAYRRWSSTVTPVDAGKYAGYMEPAAIMKELDRIRVQLQMTDNECERRGLEDRSMILDDMLEDVREMIRGIQPKPVEGKRHDAS